MVNPMMSSAPARMPQARLGMLVLIVLVGSGLSHGTSEQERAKQVALTFLREACGQTNPSVNMKRFGLPWVFMTDDDTRVDVDRKTYDVVSFRRGQVPSTQMAWDMDRTVSTADRWLASRGLDLGEPQAIIERRGYVNVVYDEPIVNGISTGGLRSFIVQVRDDQIVGYIQPPRVKFPNVRPKMSPEQAASTVSNVATQFRLGPPTLMYVLTNRSKVLDGAYIADLAYGFLQNDRDHKSYEYGGIAALVDASTGERLEEPLLYGGVPQHSPVLPVVYRERRVPRNAPLPWQPFAGVGAVVALVAYAGYRAKKSRPKIAA